MNYQFKYNETVGQPYLKRYNPSLIYVNHVFTLSTVRLFVICSFWSQNIHEDIVFGKSAFSKELFCSFFSRNIQEDLCFWRLILERNCFARFGRKHTQRFFYFWKSTLLLRKILNFKNFLRFLPDTQFYTKTMRS